MKSFENNLDTSGLNKKDCEMTKNDVRVKYEFFSVKTGKENKRRLHKHNLITLKCF